MNDTLLEVMAGERILIVDDEKDIAEIVSFNLEKEGFRTEIVNSGEEAIDVFENYNPDLIILDLMLPGMDGYDVFKRLISGKSENVPVIMLTAKSQETDVIEGLEAGADDYITKPFSPNILVARVKNVFRKIKKANVVKIGNLEIDKRKRSVTCEGMEIKLSKTEFDILSLLASKPGWVFSRGSIISAVKGDDYPVTERSVDVQVLSLRRKLGKCCGMIETVRGVGYRLHEG